MITGFNTDIEHDGVVYHVQTEDKGLDTPIILSLVYSGGAILASKRAPYEDLIASGFSDEALSERLKRQHKLICAAIHSGRINDLKKMSGRQDGAQVAESASTAPLNAEVVKDFELQTTVEIAPPPVVEPPEEEVIPQPAVEPEAEFELDLGHTQEWRPPEPKQEEPPSVPIQEEPPQEVPPPPVLKEPEPTPYTIYDPRRQQVQAQVEPEIGLVITLLDDHEFYSNEDRMVRVLVTDYTGQDHKPLSNVTVSIKILGTAFRPLIFTMKTEKDGVATVATQIPQFTSGRAAVLIRAVSKDRSAELRRVIHPHR